MKMYALFEAGRAVGGPQSENPGGWVEVEVEDVAAGVVVEWDFSGVVPTLRAKVLTSQEQTDAKVLEVKQQRNRRLADSDWTDTYSAPGRLGEALYQQWQDYRQALRDVSDQPGFPFDITWPTPPSTS